MKLINRILGGTVALFGAVALAGEPGTAGGEADCAPPSEQVQPSGPPPGKAAPKGDQPRLSKVGVSLETGGGVGGFLDSRAAGVTTEQGQWTVRGVVGTRRHFAGEFAYVGSAQTVQALGVEPRAALIGGGLEAAGRWNIMTGALQPYAVAGVGWNHYSLMGTTFNTSVVQNDADVMTFPVGGGIAYRVAGLVLDARLSFHPAFGSDLIPNANLSTWDMNAKIGFEF